SASLTPKISAAYSRIHRCASSSFAWCAPRHAKWSPKGRHAELTAIPTLAKPVRSFLRTFVRAFAACALPKSIASSIGYFAENGLGRSANTTASFVQFEQYFRTLQPRYARHFQGSRESSSGSRGGARRRRTRGTQPQKRRLSALRQSQAADNFVLRCRNSGVASRSASRRGEHIG